MSLKRLMSVLVAMGVVFFAPQADAAKTIEIKSEIPYKKNARIRDAIKKECSLGTKLSDFIVENAQKQGIDMKQTGKLKGSTRLVLSITNASVAKRVGWSLGSNLGGGGGSFVTVEGKLVKNGSTVGTFTGKRSSSGGFGGGFKSSCSLVGRCVKALGKDIATWMTEPERGSLLGD